MALVAPPRKDPADREVVPKRVSDSERWRKECTSIGEYYPQRIRKGNRAGNNLGLTLVERKTVLPARKGLLDEQMADTPAPRLRHARLSKGMSMVKLAKLAGVNVRTIVDAEGGRVTSSLPVLRKFAQGLDVSVVYLGCFDKLPERTLGERIRKAWLCKGLTKTEFAQVLGVDMKSLWAWENDKNKPSQKNHEGIRKYIEEFS